MVIPSVLKRQTIYVILLNWNGFDHTRECLKSFSFVTANHKIIVVDNGSTDGSADKIASEFPQVTLIKNETNLGYAGGNNVGIEYALKEKAPYILVLNNDTVVSPDALSTLLQSMHETSDETIFGSAIINYYKRDQLDHLGGTWNPNRYNFDLVGINAPLSKLDLIAKKPLDYITGCSLFAKGSTFAKVGLFNPDYFLFWEEADWCTRAVTKGVKLAICPKSLIYHKGSASFSGMAPHKEYFWWRSRLLWLQLHHPQGLKFIRSEIFKQARHLALLHLQKLGYTLVLSHKRQHKIHQIKRKKAALVGVKDYITNSFGPPPKGVIS